MANKKYTFNEIMQTKRGSLHTDKMSRYFYQYISNLFLWIFLKMGISANAVGAMMAIISLIAGGLFLTGTKMNLIIGTLLFIIAMVLDHTDGDVARITKVFSKKGIYLDHIHHTCEEIFTFVGLGIYLFHLTSNYYFLIAGIMITVLNWITTYFRATIYWFLKVEGYHDMKYRKLPFVLLYGDFFKIWHFLILMGLIFNFVTLIIIIAFVWTLLRFFPKMYIYYKECDLYDQEQNKIHNKV